MDLMNYNILFLIMNFGEQYSDIKIVLRLNVPVNKFSVMSGRKEKSTLYNFLVWWSQT